jgi:hypothetical protein
MYDIMIWVMWLGSHEVIGQIGAGFCEGTEEGWAFFPAHG